MNRLVLLRTIDPVQHSVKLRHVSLIEKKSSRRISALKIIIALGIRQSKYPDTFIYFRYHGICCILWRRRNNSSNSQSPRGNHLRTTRQSVSHHWRFTVNKTHLEDKVIITLFNHYYVILTSKLFSGQRMMSYWMMIMRDDFEWRFASWHCHKAL